jgi:DNA-binding LacI/PurR family transcriptional regulator
MKHVAHVAQAVKRRAGPSVSNSPPIDDRPTLRTLAASLNLSTSAVSIVLNASAAAATIPAVTRARILAAAHRMGYRPNVLAQALRRRRAFTIGLLLPDLTGDGPALAQSITDRLRTAGYDVLLATHHRRPGLIASRAHLMLERQVDGVIVVEGSRIANAAVPVVRLAYTCHRRLLSPAWLVEMDLANAAAAAIRHITELGHRRLALLTSPGPFRCPWSRALSRAAGGLLVHVDTRAMCDRNVSSFECAYIAARNLLVHGARYTTLFTSDDDAAMGVLRALRESDLAVPGDVSVVGFGDHMGAAAYTPRLTTVRIPLLQAGERAAQMIVGRIEDGTEGRRDRARPLDAVFAARETTGIPRQLASHPG